MVVSAALGEALRVYIGSVGRLTSQRWRPLSPERPRAGGGAGSRSPLAVIRAGSPPRCPLATVHAESSVMATFSAPQLKSSSPPALPPKSPLREVRLVGSAPPQLSERVGPTAISAPAPVPTTSAAAIVPTAANGVRDTTTDTPITMRMTGQRRHRSRRDSLSRYPCWAASATPPAGMSARPQKRSPRLSVMAPWSSERAPGDCSNGTTAAWPRVECRLAHSYRAFGSRDGLTG